MTTKSFNICLYVFAVLLDDHLAELKYEVGEVGEDLEWLLDPMFFARVNAPSNPRAVPGAKSYSEF